MSATTNQPSLEHRIEKAAEEMLLVCERNGLKIVKTDFGITSSTQVDSLLVTRFRNLAEIREMERAAAVNESTPALNQILEQAAHPPSAVPAAETVL